MKKSMKKHLMLALMIVALVAVTVFVTAASGVVNTAYCSKCGKTVPYTYGTIFEPQCEAEGYTELVCITHPDTVVGTANVKAALGHKLTTRDYTLDEEGKYYQHNQRCTREDCKYGLTVNKPETDDNLNEVKYCQVNFINDFVTDTLEGEVFCPYADLAKTYKTETETIYVKYPTGEDSVLVSASKEPFRQADRVFGKYVFAGWLSAEEITKLSADAETTTTFDLRHDTNEILTTNRTFNNAENRFEYNKEDSAYYDSLVKVASDKKEVKENTPATYDLYTIFEVETNAEHNVKFYNYDGYLLYETNVNHAIESAEYKGDTPLRPDNVEFTYEFLYWELLGTTTKLSTGYDIDAVYGDLKVVAYYDADIRQYNFRYFEKDGTTPIMYGDKIAEDTVTIAGFGDDRMEAEIGLAIGKVEPYFDATYDYVHTGKWLIPSRGNHVVDLNSISLPYGTLDNNEIEYIALVPQYQSYLRMYKLVVNIVYADDGNYHPRNIKLQVTNSDGKGIGYAEIDQSEMYYKDGTYTVVFDVAYSKSYTVTATSTGYTGTANTVFHEFNPDDRDDDKPGNILMEMKVVEGDPCNCICHTIFKPVWVGILNLLNSLFKLEYVCCDDMFANIGGELNYGPATSK